MADSKEQKVQKEEEEFINRFVKNSDLDSTPPKVEGWQVGILQKILSDKSIQSILQDFSFVINSLCQCLHLFFTSLYQLFEWIKVTIQSVPFKRFFFWLVITVYLCSPFLKDYDRFLITKNFIKKQLELLVNTIFVIIHHHQ